MILGHDEPHNATLPSRRTATWIRKTLLHFPAECDLKEDSQVAWQGLCLNTAHARLPERLPWASLPGQSSWGCDAPSGFQAARCRAGERGTWPLQQSRDLRPQRGA